MTVKFGLVVAAFAAFAFSQSVRPAMAQCPAWEQVSVGPTADEARMVFDPVRNRHVLYSGLRHETWEYDGAAWRLGATGGPTAVSGYAMTFDRTRGVCVLFGGQSASPVTTLRETWEWDGKVWSLRSTTGPSARTRTAMAFDESRNVSVLFGGGTARDTWEWNGTDWTRVATTGPLGRQGHAMVYDAARNLTVMFGATLGGIDETWEWNGSSWTMREDESIPSGRSLASLVYDRAAGRVLLYGGYLGTPYEDLWSLTSAGWQWLGGTGRPVYGHTADFDEPSGRMFAFGGIERQIPHTPRRDLVALNGTAWQSVWRPLMPAQFSELGNELVGAYDSVNGRTCFFNSFGVWSFDGLTLTQLGAEGRQYLRNVAFDPATATFFTARGSAGGQIDIEETDGSAWQITDTINTGDWAAWGYCAYDTVRNVRVLVVRREQTPDGPFDHQTWESGGSGWTLAANDGRRVSSVTFDPTLGVLTLLAAADWSVFSRWDGKAWTDLPPPPATLVGALSCDLEHGGTIVAGTVRLADGRVYQRSVLAFDGAEWRYIGTPSPRPDTSYPWMAYDAARSLHVAPFWNESGVPSIAMFDLAEVTLPNILTQPVDAAVPFNAPASFSVTVESDPAVSRYHWLHDGVEIDEIDDPGVSGETSADLTILHAAPERAGLYSIRVGNGCGNIFSDSAELVVTCGHIDWDGDGVANSTDVSAFINDWFTDQAKGSLITDIDGNGVVNSTDVSTFINDWFAAPAWCR